MKDKGWHILSVIAIVLASAAIVISIGFSSSPSLGPVIPQDPHSDDDDCIGEFCDDADDEDDDGFCADTDGGQDFFVQGTCTELGGHSQIDDHTDTCVWKGNQLKLREYYCRSKRDKASCKKVRPDIICSEILTGGECIDGACVASGTGGPNCGDGIVQPTLGEECDDGPNDIPGDGCYACLLEKPDMFVTGFYSNPFSCGFKNADTQVFVNISNSGDLNANVDITTEMAFELEASFLGNFSVPPIPYGQTVTAPACIPLPPPGFFNANLTVFVDTTQLVAESDETNNAFSVIY